MEIFAPQTGYSADALRFLTSDLGRLWQKIPFEQLAESVTRRLIKQGIHVPSWGYMDIRGGIALEVLKRYHNGLSDKKVIENLNLCPAHRWFCFMKLPMTERIKDKDLLVRWRQFLGKHLDTESLNRVLLQAWQGELEHKHVRMSDATVYEVKIAYPQSAVLLYEACNWVYKQYSHLSASLGLGKQKRQYRKFEEQHKRQTNWSKTRKKTHKKTQGRKRELLYWLKKGLDLLKDIWLIYQAQVADGLQKKIPPRHEKRYQTIKTLYQQQQTHFTATLTATLTAAQSHAESKIPDRIVSLNQPHIRPIVRGKTNKPVEFGPKVNILRIGRLALIEHSSFNAFHEGNRMTECCTKYSYITGKCQQFAGDAIYATNANRRFATQNNIQTSFKHKGKMKNDPTLKKQEMTLKKELGKVRSTHLEGSFGNQKQHYAANKITSKTPETQSFTLFAALLTANAMALVNQNNKDNKKECEKREKQNTQNKKTRPQARAA